MPEIQSEPYPARSPKKAPYSSCSFKAIHSEHKAVVLSWSETVRHRGAVVIGGNHIEGKLAPEFGDVLLAMARWRMRLPDFDFRQTTKRIFGDDEVNLSYFREYQAMDSGSAQRISRAA